MPFNTPGARLMENLGQSPALGPMTPPPASILIMHLIWCWYSGVWLPRWVLTSAHPDWCCPSNFICPPPLSDYLLPSDLGELIRLLFGALTSPHCKIWQICCQGLWAAQSYIACGTDKKSQEQEVNLRTGSDSEKKSQQCFLSLRDLLNPKDNSDATSCFWLCYWKGHTSSPPLAACPDSFLIG